MSLAEEVLIIDDDRSVRSALTNLIRSAGLTARSYGSVDGFLADPIRPTAGCFLLDVRLPGLNGLDFQEKMSELGLRLPVILMTGYRDLPMTAKAIGAGAIDFLTKPFQGNGVLEAIDRALHADRQRRSREAEILEA